MPLIALTRYQLLPLFQPGQYVPHDPPLTLPATVTVLLGPSATLIDAVVVAPLRMFTPSQAGTYGVPLGEGVVVGEDTRAGDGAGVGDGVEIGVGVGAGVGLGAGASVGDAAGAGVGEGVGVGVGEAGGAGVGAAEAALATTSRTPVAA